MGELDTTATNRSILKDQYREADFLTGYLCGLTGRCDLQEKLSDCMPEEVSYELKDSIEAMSEGMMNGELIDNLIMGLFNLNFAM